MADPDYPDTSQWQSEQGWTSATRQASRPSGHRSSRQNDSLIDLIILGLGRTVWSYSFELLLLLMVLAPTVAGEVYGHSQLGSFGTVALFSTLVALGPARRTLHGLLRVSATRRC